MKIGKINFNPLAVKAQKKAEFVKAFEGRIEKPSEVYDELLAEAKKIEVKLAAEEKKAESKI